MKTPKRIIIVLSVSIGTSKYGPNMTTKTILGIVVTGRKFLSIYFVVFAAKQPAVGIGEILKDYSTGDLTPMWICLGMAGISTLPAWKVPQTAADLVTGTLSFSDRDIMTVYGGKATATAGGSTSLAGHAANSFGGALKARSALTVQASATGATGIGGVAGGATSTLGTAGLGEPTDALEGFARRPHKTEA